MTAPKADRLETGVTTDNPYLFLILVLTLVGTAITTLLIWCVVVRKASWFPFYVYVAVALALCLVLLLFDSMTPVAVGTVGLIGLVVYRFLRNGFAAEAEQAAALHTQQAHRAERTDVD